MPNPTQKPTPQQVAAEIKALPARSAPADLKKVLYRLLELIMAAQSDIDALTTAVTGAVAGINTAVGNVNTASADLTSEIAALKQANPSLDLSGLQGAVGNLSTALTGLGTAVSGLQALDTANKPTSP